MNTELDLALKILNGLKAGYLQKCNKTYLVEQYAKLVEYDNQYMDTMTKSDYASRFKKRAIITSLRNAANNAVNKYNV